MTLQRESPELFRLELRKIVEVIHHRGQRGVEAQPLDMIGYRANRFVRTLEGLVTGISFWRARLDVAPHHRPHAREITPGARDTVLVPVGRLVEGTHEEFPQPQWVGAVLL